MPHSVLNKELDKFRELTLMTSDGNSCCLGCSQLDWAKTYCGKQVSGKVCDLGYVT